MSVEYAIPHDMCEDVMGTAIPEEYFPPGERLHHNGMEAPASPTCRAYVDGDYFLRFQGLLKTNMPGENPGDTLEYDVDRFDTLDEFPTTGEPDSSTYKEYEIEAWPELVVATRACTSPYLENPDRYFRLMLAVHLPEDFENPEEALAQFIGPAAETLFDRVPMCEESPAYDPD